MAELAGERWGTFFLKYLLAPLGSNIQGTVSCGFTLPDPQSSVPFSDPHMTFYLTPKGLAPYIFTSPLARVTVSGHDGTHTLYRVRNHDRYEKFLDYAESKAAQLERIFLGDETATITVIESRRLGSDSEEN